VSSIHHLYLYEDNLYLPHLARTEAGFLLELEPVVRMPKEPVRLRKALEGAFREGNPSAPTPARHEYPSVPVVVRSAGARTMLVFERHATMWSILAGDTELRLDTLTKVRRAGWGSPEKTEIFPRDRAGMDSLINAVLGSGAPAG
jgi:hypothetical protein